MLQEQEQPLRRPMKPGSLMTPKQGGEFLGIKLNTLYEMTSQGRVRERKVGHRCALRLTRWSRNKGQRGRRFGEREVGSRDYWSTVVRRITDRRLFWRSNIPTPLTPEIDLEG